MSEVTSKELSDRQKRELLAANLAEFQQWQNLAAEKGWRLPGNSPLPRESWINYWKACLHHEKDPSSGRPVAPHRSA